MAAFLLVLLATALCGPSAAAMPVLYSISELARMSDAIVVARVESIHGLPLVGRRWATARVIEVWKGPPLDTVKFLASPTGFCDVASAERGEIALLFLSKGAGTRWQIENSGRGRMPLRFLGGKEYVTYLNVAFPVDAKAQRLADDHSDQNSAVEFEVTRRIVNDALGIPTARDGAREQHGRRVGDPSWSPRAVGVTRRPN